MEHEPALDQKVDVCSSPATGDVEADVGALDHYFVVGADALELTETGAVVIQAVKGQAKAVLDLK